MFWIFLQITAKETKHEQAEDWNKQYNRPKYSGNYGHPPFLIPKPDYQPNSQSFKHA